MSAVVILLPPGFWLGPDRAEAQDAYSRAREAGMPKTRAEVLGHVGSRKDLWAAARNIARRIGCSVRTVQRALAQGSALGLVRTARGKKDEVPPGAKGPIWCGFSHRWIIGRGLGGARLREAIGQARARWLQRFATRREVPREWKEHKERPEPRRPPAGVSTLEWLRAELGELADAKARDGPT